MSLSSLLAAAQPLVTGRLGEHTQLAPRHPACILFFSISDGKTRARVCRASGADFSAAWKEGVARCRRLAQTRELEVSWLRVDWVSAVFATTWGELDADLAKTKRNYFRYGLAFDAGFEHALLEQELNANAMLYGGNELAAARRNTHNFAAYLSRRFGASFQPDFAAETPVWRFASEGLFLSDEPALSALPGGGAAQALPGPDTAPHARWKSALTLESGHRDVSPLDTDATLALIRSSSEFLARQVQADGRFIYGHFPCFGREIPTYNALRHASSVYSMLEAWELTRAAPLTAAIERAMAYLTQELIRHYPRPDGGTIAFNVDINDEIKLGANAVSLLALVKYEELTGDHRHRPLMEALALGIAQMQDAATGKFIHVLNAADLSTKDTFRIIYYDGEAAFGLMRLYGLTRDPRWLAIVEKAFDHFLAADHWKAHDHWLSYCANELTRYKPEEKYFRFGVQNIADYLDFILTRETTFPTLLELSMAFEQMLGRIRQIPEMQHVLDGFDVDKFHRALHHRAHYLLNGFFWPEMAMYFARPESVVGSFFIRHHSFRVRIDDVEHYLSGFVAYWKLLSSPRRPPEADNDPLPSPAASEPRGPVVAWGGDVNLGRRQHYRTAELGADKVLRIPALRDADLRIVNLECVVATQGEQGVRKGEGGPYYYRARPEMLRVLASAGIDLVTVANNHSGDYGPEALLEQAGWLDAFGIAHAGSGKNAEQAFTPALRRAGSLNVAVFALDATQHRFAATIDTPGCAHLPLQDPATWKARFAPLIARARVQAHIVLVAVHWGANLAREPGADEIAAGHALIDAGADAVLGASAHVLQGIEIHQGRPIIYDAGDLLFDSIRKTPGQSGVFQLELGADGVKRVTFVPVGVGFGFSAQHSGAEAVAAARDYARCCETMGTHLQLTQEGLAFIDLHPPPRAHRPLPPAPTTRYDLACLEEMQAQGTDAWQVKEVPSDARIEPLRFGPLTLLGVRMKPLEALTRRRMLWVETFWRSDGPIDEDIRLDIRGVPVRPTTMRPWGEGMDHDPCDWMMPTSRWQPGVIYRDHYGLRPPYLKDWKNVDLQLSIGIISRQHAPCTTTLPYFVRLAVPGKDEAPPAPTTPSYRTEFPSIIHDCLPGQTWTAAQLEAVTGGKWLVRPPEGWFVRSVVAGTKHIDLLPAPTLFIGHDSHDRCRHEQSKLPAKNFDRHSVISGQVSSLAGALVRTPEISSRLPTTFPILQVEDPIRSLIELGLAARSRYKHPVIAITGTVGKSSTLHMLEEMLRVHGRALTTIDNYNSRVGVPAMLASLAADDHAALLEIAQSALWMRRGPITRLVRPWVSIITEIALSQTNAMVRNIDDVVRWKSRIFEGLSGPAIAVIGDHLHGFQRIADSARGLAKRIVVYGESATAEVRLLESRPGVLSQSATLSVGGRIVALELPVAGKGMLRNALAALAALYALGYDVEQCAARLSGYRSPEGRLVPREIRINGSLVTLIDDSYNAEVASMIHAFEVLAMHKVSSEARRIAVLGRIVHLGDQAQALHECLAEPLLANGVDHVVTHGAEMCYLREMLPSTMLGPHFSSAPELVEYMTKTLRAGDVVLVKGSRRDSDFGLIPSLLAQASNA